MSDDYSNNADKQMYITRGWLEWTICFQALDFPLLLEDKGAALTRDMQVYELAVWMFQGFISPVQYSKL